MSVYYQFNNGGYKKGFTKIKVKHDKFVSEKELANKNNIEKLKQKLLKLGLSYMGFQDEPDSINNENWVKEKNYFLNLLNLGR